MKSNKRVLALLIAVAIMPLQSIQAQDSEIHSKSLETDLIEILGGEEPQHIGKFIVEIMGQGQLIHKNDENGNSLSSLAFADLHLKYDDQPLSAGFHARVFLSSADVTNGNTPNLNSLLKLVEGYIEYKPQGADGIHILRLNAGRSWVAFGYGIHELASFASFPMISSMSTAGIGFAPNATLVYENRKLGFVIDGSLFSPQEGGSYMNLKNQGYSIRIQKGIPITSNQKVDAMASYANLYYPTSRERSQYLSGGARIRAQLGKDVSLEILGEALYQKKVAEGAHAGEMLGWLALISLKVDQLTTGVRFNESYSSEKTAREIGAFVSYRATPSSSRYQVDIFLEVIRQTTFELQTDSRRYQIGGGARISF